MSDATYTRMRVTLDPRDVERIHRIGPRALKAAQLSGWDAIRATRAEAKRGVRERVRMRARYLQNVALPLHSYALTWVMRVRGSAVPLSEFPRRQVRKGVVVEVRPGKRALIKSAFLAKRRGGIGVFMRPTKERYPMGHRLGPSVPDVMSDGEVPEAALTRGAEVFISAFRRILEKST